jgi:hypothetical protein
MPGLVRNPHEAVRERDRGGGAKAERIMSCCHSDQAVSAPSLAAATFSVQARFHSSAAAAVGRKKKPASTGSRAAIVVAACAEASPFSVPAFIIVRASSRMRSSALPKQGGAGQPVVHKPSAFQ